MFRLRFLSILVCSSLVFLSACSESGISDKSNIAPTVDAGDSQTIYEQTVVTLVASASDSDGSIDSYVWSQTSGTVVTLSATYLASTSFTAPAIASKETLTFRITATDDDGETSSDSVDVTVNPTTTVTGALNDTGITLCGDFAYEGGSGTHNNDVNCALTDDSSEGKGGDPIPGDQDGYYGRDADANTNSAVDGHAGFSFTKLDAIGGGDLASNAMEWGCVRDNVTGLVWEVKDTSGLRSSSHTYSWFNSTGVNDGGRAGKTNFGSCSDGSGCDTEKFVTDVNTLTQPLCGYTD